MYTIYFLENYRIAFRPCAIVCMLPICCFLKVIPYVEIGMIIFDDFVTISWSCI